MGVSVNGVPGLDIEMEMKLVQQTLNQLQQEGATQHEIKLAMKDLGIKRANFYGWPNTYVFTKAMGEMLLKTVKKDTSVVVIRPTMVTSTYKEPFLGWTEGTIRSIDSIAVAYGKGALTCFLGDNEAVSDFIPADMVINAMLAAMVAHANQANNDDIIIYHVGSSASNPLKLPNTANYLSRFFTAKPLLSNDGKPIKVGKLTLFNNVASFNLYLFLRYLLPLQVLNLMNKVSCNYFEEIYIDYSRMVHVVMRMADLYKPYAFFAGIFDNKNTVKLLEAARRGLEKEEMNLFEFDPKIIDWKDYFINVHLPGVVKYLLK
ncbi:hypothetical protein PIB30_018577 [Stylosanthes scabra]|uniref:Fatty acyl-CoA reductase n=1 Tax=Stylosanthes scabra TaxID=79078 RepID=A0ABU6R877_9FABA|nr:hypothetical protein [Stylosanthes scabra]